VRCGYYRLGAKRCGYDRFGKSPLGNITFGKLPLGKLPLGKMLSGKYLTSFKHQGYTKHGNIEKLKNKQLQFSY